MLRLYIRFLEQHPHARAFCVRVAIGDNALTKFICPVSNAPFLVKQFKPAAANTPFLTLYQSPADRC